VSDEIEQCRDLSNIVYRRPFDRGMLVSWDAEKVIWDRIFGKDGMNVSEHNDCLASTIRRCGIAWLGGLSLT
jgi:actin-related protein 6